MKRTLTLVFIVFSTVLVRAQIARVSDSLEAVLPSLKGRALVDAYNTIAGENLYADIDKMDVYIRRADSLGRVIGYREGVLLAGLQKAKGVYWRGDLQGAHALFTEYLNRAQQLGYDSGIFLSYVGQWITSFRAGKAAEAYGGLMACRSWVQGLPESKKKTNFIVEINGLEITYLQQKGNYDAAHILAEKSLEYAIAHHGNAASLGLAYKTLSDSEHFRNHYTVSERHLKKALGYYTRARDAHQVEAIYSILAELYAIQGRYDTAIIIHKNLLAHNEKIRYKIGIGEIRLNIGRLNVLRGKFADAIQDQLAALDIFKERNRTVLIVRALSELATTYNKLRNYPRAIYYLKQALLFAETFREGSLAWPIDLYIPLSKTYLLNHDYDSAGVYAQKALAWATRAGNHDAMAVEPLNNLAEMYIAQGKVDSAAAPLRRLTALLDGIEDTQQRIYYFNNQGSYHFAKHNYADATKAYEQAFALSKANRDVESELHATRGLYAINKKLGNTKDALTYFEKYSAIEDSIYNVATANEITDVLINYQTAEKQRENEILKNRDLLQDADLQSQRQSIILISIVLLSAIVMGAFIARAYLIRRRTSIALYEKNQEIELQNEEIKAKNEEIQSQNEQLEASFKELKYAQAVMVQTEKMASLGQLTAGIAHEINNPINFIANGVDGLVQQVEVLTQVLAEYEKLTPEQAAGKLKEIEKLKKQLMYGDAITDIHDLSTSIKTGVKRTSDIIKGLRTFSHEGDKAFGQINIAEQLEATLLMTRSELKGRIEVEKKYDPDLPLVECNIGEINQVFMNIIMNAIQAMPDAGVLTISTSYLRAKERAVVEFQDTGIGMSAEVQSRIFDPFYTTKEVGKGTGLGLAISNTIMEKHHGTISVRSEEGHGTTFRLELPLHQPQSKS